MAMSPELQTYYEEILAMMGSKGWALLVEDVQVMAEPLNNVMAIQNNEELRFRQGQLAMIDWFVTAKARFELAYSELSAE